MQPVNDFVRRRILIQSVSVAVCAAVLLGNVVVHAAHLHVVIAVDETNPTVGPACAYDGLHVEGTILSHVDGNAVKVTKIPPASMDSETILRSIRRLSVNADDTLLFYYSGHGAYDKSKGQYFQLRGRDYLLRKQVSAALEQHRPRLVVLISDCCYRELPLPALPKFAPAMARVEATSPGFRTLFFRTRGVVDITSSQPGEYSWTYQPKDGKADPHGSIFTQSLVEVLNLRADDPKLNWQEVYTESKKTTASECLADNTPAAQTVYAFRLPRAVEVDDHNPPPDNGGQQWSAPKYYPEQGDHIVEVNGRKINDTDDFYNAVKGSPDWIIFRVIDHRTDRPYTLRTQLNPTTARSRLGIGVHDCDAEGVHVDYVKSGSPGNRCQQLLK